MIHPLEQKTKGVSKSRFLELKDEECLEPRPQSTSDSIARSSTLPLNSAKLQQIDEDEINEMVEKAVAEIVRSSGTWSRSSVGNGK